ncbi:MAG: DUF6151 family protein [Hyphomicrobiaceae bacterium]|nr:DUF6151 family protein [Hyphomicrobiaceae bacterium]
MANATVRCRCGAVEGQVANASGRTANRVVCYCDDCQAFAHHLGRADLLDGNGGTDIVQVAPARVTLTKGQEHIAGVRLSPRGLHRWHTTCCNTPFGNTVGPQIPFVGFVAQDFDHDGQRADAVFGKPIGAILGRYATGEVPAKWQGMPLGIVVRALRRVLGWKLTGKTWPHPFFERSGVPRYPIRVLTREERQALRPLCGPRPVART